MSTLHVRKVGSGWRQALALGGASGNWLVTDSSGTLASARTRLTTYDVEIENRGRPLTLRMAGGLGWRSPKQLEIAETGSGRPVVTGAFRSGGRGLNNLIAEEWSVTLASGSTITWTYWQAKHLLGFYDGQTNPVLLVGHDPSFEPPAQGGTLRILLRFWAAAAASRDRYIAQVATRAVGGLVPADDVPALAFLGVWLERTADSRYPSSASGAGT